MVVTVTALVELDERAAKRPLAASDVADRVDAAFRWVEGYTLILVSAEGVPDAAVEDPVGG